MKVLWQWLKAPISKMRFGFILLFILALGLALRMHNLSGRSLWTDEFFTLFLSSGHGVDVVKLVDGFSKRETPPLLKSSDFRLFLENDSTKHIKDVTIGLLDTDTHPPLYFWIIYIWMKLFGNGLFVLRFFSVLMGAFAIFLSYRIGERLFNQRSAVFCALFTAISAFSVRYSQEARSYSLIMVIGLLSSLFLLKLEKDNKNRDAFWFAVFSALGLYTHYFYAFVAIAHFLYFRFVHKRESVMIKKFYLAVLSSLFLFSPWLILVTLKGYNFVNAEWIFGYPGLIDKIGNIFSGFGRYLLIFDQPGFLARISLLAGMVFFVYIAFNGIREIFIKYRRQFWFCLSIFSLPLFFMFLLDVLQHGALLRQERFWMFSFLGFIPLAGYSLNFGFSRNRMFTLLFILLMLVSALFVSRVQFGPAPKNSCVWINGKSQAKASAVIACNMRGVLFAQSYYLGNDIYLLPVSGSRQLADAVKMSASLFDKLFIVRHYYRTNNSLINEPFMEARDIGGDFKLTGEINLDEIAVSEFTRRTL